MVTISLFVLLVICNIPPFCFMLNMNSEFKDYRYSNATGSCTFWECRPKSRDFDVNAFKKYLRLHPGLIKDTTIYRLFKIEPFAFWRYGMYIFESRYHLPYKNWEDIEKVRGKVENKSGFQNF